MQGVDELAAAVKPSTLAHAAEVADVSRADLSELLAAVRRAGRVAIETGTGVTMTADKANVTQWLAWALMILTGSMNRRGGTWFHPGFAYQLEAFELPISPPEGTFGPGPRSRPGTQSFMGEWPCAALPDEIEAGNIRAVLNLGGSLLTSFPNTAVLESGARGKLEVLATTEITANATAAASTHVLPTKDQLRAVRPHHLGCAQFARSRSNTLPLSSRRSPTGARCGGSWRSSAVDSATTSPTPASPMTPCWPVCWPRRGARSTRLLRRAGWMQDMNYPRRGWSGISSGWVAGAWRRALLVEQLETMREPAPLVLTPRRQMRRLNAQFDFLGDPADVLIHPDDGAASGVVDGKPVTVRSAHGELTGLAKLDPAIRRGAVSVPHGHVEANVNALTR